MPGQCGQGAVLRGSGHHLDHLSASFAGIDISPSRPFQNVEEGGCLVESKHTPELRRWLQRGGLTRIEGDNNERGQHREASSGRPIGRSHCLEVVLDFIHGFPGRGQGASQVEEELL